MWGGGVGRWRFSNTPSHFKMQKLSMDHGKGLTDRTDVFFGLKICLIFQPLFSFAVDLQREQAESMHQQQK